MTIDESKQAIAAAAETIAAAWSQLRDYDIQPAGIVVEIVVSKRELAAAKKIFDPLIGSQLSVLHQRLITMYGDTEAQELLVRSIRESRRRIDSAVPSWVNAVVAVSEAVYRSNEYALRYSAVGEKSRLGEAVLACYPRCGIPCGWDEREGVLMLYQTRIP